MSFMWGLDQASNAHLPNNWLWIHPQPCDEFLETGPLPFLPDDQRQLWTAMTTAISGHGKRLENLR